LTSYLALLYFRPEEYDGVPRVFVFDYRGMDAGWFFYNLLSALANAMHDAGAGTNPDTVASASRCRFNSQF